MSGRYTGRVQYARVCQRTLAQWSIPDVSNSYTKRVRYTRFQWNNPKLAPFDFYLQSKLQAPTRDDNIHREPAQELEQHKYQMKCELRHDICFTDVQTRSSPTLC